jgi:ABC-type uncharacterized transport system ATPase subunit
VAALGGLLFGFDTAVISGTTDWLKRQFGLIPETSNIYNDMTAWENLIFSAKLYGVKKDEEGFLRKILPLRLFKFSYAPSANKDVITSCNKCLS